MEKDRERVFLYLREIVVQDDVKESWFRSRKEENNEETDSGDPGHHLLLEACISVHLFMYRFNMYSIKFSL